MARNNGWTLGVGYNPDGVRMREQRPPDAHCVNCSDEYLQEELLNNKCFSCRYYENLVNKKGIDIIPSFSGTEGLIFPI